MTTDKKSESAKKVRANWTIWLVGGVAVAAAAFGISLLPLAEWVQFLRDWIETLGAVGFVVFALAYVVAAVFLIPVWPLSISGGLLFGMWGFAWVPVCATLGACAAFLLSRYFARGKVREWLASRPQFNAVDKAIGEEGWKVVILLRVSPLVPYNLMNYFCGLSRVRFPSFVVATFLGSIPVTAMYVYLGLVGQKVAGGTMGWPQWALLVVGLIATVAVTILITRKIRPKLQRS